MRAMHARLSAGIKDGSITQEMAADVASPLRVLKGLFPNSPLAKHTPLDIFLSAPLPNRQRPLVFRDLGSIESDWVATEFVINYFDTNAPSPAVRLFFSKKKSRLITYENMPILAENSCIRKHQIICQVAPGYTYIRLMFAWEFKWSKPSHIFHYYPHIYSVANRSRGDTSGC